MNHPNSRDDPTYDYNSGDYDSETLSSLITRIPFCLAQFQID